MKVIRVEKSRDYTVMSNEHMRQKEMSLRAKGLLSLMLTLPDTWEFTVAGIASICKESEDIITATLGELKRFGYLRVIRHNPSKENGGKISYEYVVYEKCFLPDDSPGSVPQNEGTENQGTENEGTENQGTENGGTDILNTYKSNTEVLNNNNTLEGAPAPAHTHARKVAVRGKFIPPTEEEVAAYCSERKSPVDPARFHAYYESNGWRVGKNPMKDWRAAIKSWERQDKKREEKRDRTAHPETESSFSTDEFFDSALEKSYGKKV